MEFRTQESSLIQIADRECLEKILSNLLSNALKFTEQGKVEMDLRRSNGSSNGSSIEWRVRDTGPGIAAPDHSVIFERFRQVDSGPTRTHGGTGIGLALARELARLHGGDVSVESRPGAGSTFTLRIPFVSSNIETDPGIDQNRANDIPGSIARAYVSGPAAPSEQSNDRKTLPQNEAFPKTETILVVEDNPEMRDYLAEQLGAFYHILLAANGAEALRAIQSTPPDLILADIMMPKMDGLQLTEVLKTREESEIPLILLTARGHLDSRLRGLNAGADDYLTKPFQFPELLARVRGHLNRSLRKKNELLEDREILFRDLHDYIGGSLTDLAQIASRLRTEADDPALPETLEETLQELNKYYRHILSQAGDLDRMSQNFLDGVHLVLLRRYSLSQRQLFFDASDDVRGMLQARFSARRKRILFSIFREIATNDLKYGRGASEWSFSALNGNEFPITLTMNVQTEFQSSQGRGTENLRIHARQLGARIESNQDSDRFRLRLSIPEAAKL